MILCKGDFMTSSSKIFYLLLMLGLIFSLTGCELARNNNDTGDMSPVQALPPTLAPLGSENSEATAVPTVLNVQATTVVSSASASSAVANSVELVPPTVQPTQSAANNSQAQPVTASTSPTPAAAKAATPAPSIVVSATTPQDLPQGGPIAVNPPVSNTSGVIPAASNGGTYIVQAGDTLFAISQRYGTSIEAIVSANGLNSDMVQIGQTLTIPGANADAAPSAAPFASGAPTGAYVVTANDTLFSIARRFNTSVEAIANANNIGYPYIIYDGQTLTIPAAGAAPVTGGAYAPNQGYQQQPQAGYPNQGYQQQPQAGYPNQNYSQQDQGGGYTSPTVPNGAATHTVAPGETLYSIARRYGVPVEVMAAANGLSDPNQLFVGQVLYLP
jgi:LysM repeat protein